jgi:hypothetical protein
MRHPFGEALDPARQRGREAVIPGFFWLMANFCREWRFVVSLVLLSTLQS